MNSREWLMSDRNMADAPIESFTDLSESERANLALLHSQCRGWSSQDIEMVVAAMAEDGVYHDITLEPAVGHAAIREFGANWMQSVPDLSLYIESFCVQGNVVSNLGRMSGTIAKEYFGVPPTGQKFDVQFSQMCFIENGKIKYLRGLWNAADMYNQVGWDLSELKRA
jgi:limonene-1,2-epoxide hydrolase